VWAIVLIVVGALVLVTLVGVGIFFAYRAWKTPGYTSNAKEDMHYLLMNEYPGFTPPVSRDRGPSFMQNFVD